MELKEVISELEKYDGVYKEAQVNYALEHQAEITPYLINILKNVIANPSTSISDKNYFGHIYALMLLGYFKETKAHDVLIELFSLPDKLIEELYGDIALEECRSALYQTCGGSVEKIKKMVLDKNVSESMRNSAADALLYAVVDGVLTREEALKFYSALFPGDETVPAATFWGFIACDICDLCPDDQAYDVIKRAYRDNLIDTTIIGFKEFQKAIDDGVEVCLDKIRYEKIMRLNSDFHKRMSWWACFEGKVKDDIDFNFNPELLALLTAGPVPKKKTKKKPKPKLIPKKKKKRKK